MRVFLSWSGDKSKAAAEALRDWLPDVIQSVEPWMSSADIDAGMRWSRSVEEQLSSCRYGIIILTSENQQAPWIMFEAGALAKTLTETYVCPFLIDLTLPAMQAGPLTQFQAKEATRAGTQDLVRSINKALGEDALPEDRLARSFARYWPDLEGQFKNLCEVPTGSAEKRPLDDTVEEILLLTRGLSRQNVSDTSDRPINWYEYLQAVRRLRSSPQEEALRSVRSVAELKERDIYLVEEAVMRAIWGFFNPWLARNRRESGDASSIRSEDGKVSEDA